MTPATIVLVGALSMYRVDDGYSGKITACQKPFTKESHHIAIRNWKGLCDKKATVCVGDKCVNTVVGDAGPWGALCPGKKWRVFTRKKPKECHYRGIVDASERVWRELGKPAFLTEVVITIYK